MHGKLKLDLNELAVESFDTSEAEKREGTVFGEQCTCWTNCTCPGCPSCDGGACGGTEHTACNQASCNGTCDASCNGTCAGQYSCGPDCWGTQVDYTCNGYGTCGVYPCKIVP